MSGVNNMWVMQKLLLNYGKIHQNRYYRQGKADTMSIDLALVGTDGIVCATDSAEMFEDGEYMEIRDVPKIWLLESNIVLMQVTQNAAFTKWIKEVDIDKFVGKEDIRGLSFEDKIKKISENLISQSSIYYPSLQVEEDFVKLMSHPDHMEFTFAGYNEEYIPRIYSLGTRINDEFFKPCICGNWHIMGLRDIARYLLSTIYTELYSNQVDGNKPLQKINILQNVATWIIYEMSLYTKKVKLPVQMVIIPKEGDAYKVKDDDILRFQDTIKEKSNNLRSMTLKTLFEN